MLPRGRDAGPLRQLREPGTNPPTDRLTGLYLGSISLVRFTCPAGAYRLRQPTSCIGSAHLRVVVTPRSPSLYGSSARTGGGLGTKRRLTQQDEDVKEEKLNWELKGRGQIKYQARAT